MKDKAPLPGFRIGEYIVVKRLSFDVYDLMRRLNIRVELHITEASNKQMREIRSKYYTKKPEITDAISGECVFSMAVYEDDIYVLMYLFAKALKFKKIPLSFSYEKDKLTVEEVTYEQLLKDAGIQLNLSAKKWEHISDKSIDVEKEIKKKIPQGIEKPDFSWETFYKYVSEIVMPAVHKAGWKGGNAWLINLGLKELRNGNYQEAAYAFDGVRIDLVKSTLFNEEAPLKSLVNSCLISLRDSCISCVVNSKITNHHELFIEIPDRELIFVPKFLSQPTFDDPYFRFSTNVWIANALVLIAAVANSMDPPTISRYEVDPFGTSTTRKNIFFVLKASKRLFELDTYNSLEEWREKENDALPLLKSIDFTELIPEITLTRVFSEVGYRIEDYGMPFLRISDTEKIDISYDILMTKEDALFLVILIDGKKIEIEDVKRLYSKIKNCRHKVNLFLVSGTEYSGEIVDYSENVAGIELFYLDVESESVKSIKSNLSLQSSKLIPSENLKEINRLYTDVEKAKTSQDKGTKLEKLMGNIFNDIVPDTKILMTNPRTAAEEFDLVLTNYRKTFPWKDLGAIVLVECKNWSKPAGDDVVALLKDKMEAIGQLCSTSILVSWNGISDKIQKKNANQKIREYRKEGKNILVLDKNDIVKIVKTGNTKEVFENKFKELIKR